MRNHTIFLSFVLICLATFSANAEIHDVSITGFAFVPETVTFQVGDTVRWTNNDPVAHTATSTDNPPVFDSGNLASGETYMHQFTESRFYPYFCEIHPSMTGTVHAESATSVEENSEEPVPSTFQLGQNYPNPFNNKTTIQYTITGTKPRHVTLAIYDIQGQKVAELVNQQQAPGIFMVKWNGINLQGELVSSGLYFFRLSSGKYQKTKRLTFLK